MMWCTMFCESTAETFCGVMAKESLLRVVRSRFRLCQLLFRATRWSAAIIACRSRMKGVLCLGWVSEIIGSLTVAFFDNSS